MEFERLQQLSIQNAMLHWVSATEPHPSMTEAVMSHDIELAAAYEEFANSNPDHVINKINKPLPIEHEEKYVMATTALWECFMQHRNSKTEPSDEYFDLFDKVVELTRERMALSGYTSPIQFHEYNFADPSVLLETVAKMAEIVKKAIDNEVSNKVPEPQSFTVQEVNNMLVAFKPEVYFRVTSENGSFMSGITNMTSRIHIKRDENVNDMHSSGSHELGHALYQTRFLNKHTLIGKLGGCLSLSLHESSSIFHESVLSGIDFNVMKGHSMNMKRLTADRLHYILHIFLRIQIEKEIFEDGLTAREIPARWNALMKEYFGIEPQSAHDGFMQDVHWNDGSFGYFHSYAIGLLNAWYMLSNVKEELDKLGEKPDTTGVILDIILPEIEKTYGTFNEETTDMFAKIHPDLSHSLRVFEEFVNKNFNVIK